jgi:hypothetical protein
MFHYVMFVYTALLFFVLTPGVLLSLPPKSSKMVVAATHAIVFAFVFQITQTFVINYAMKMEGFQETRNGGSGPAKPAKGSM